MTKKKPPRRKDYSTRSGSTEGTNLALLYPRCRRAMVMPVDDSPIEEIDPVEAYNILKLTCDIWVLQYRLHMEGDDLRHSIILHFLEKGYLKHYKPSLTSKESYVMVGARRYLVDAFRCCRFAGRLTLVPIQEVGDEISEVAEEEYYLLMYELLEILSGDPEKEGSFKVTDLAVRMTCCEKSVAYLLIVGFSRREVRQIFSLREDQLERITGNIAMRVSLCTRP